MQEKMISAGIVLALMFLLMVNVNKVYSQPQTTEYNLVVKVIANEWRIVMADDTSKSDVTVKRGDRIRWIVEGSDASFQFPDSRITGLSTRTVRDGNPLVLAISSEAPSGIHPYSVFIHKDFEYARGQSPPRIIIE